VQSAPLSDTKIPCMIEPTSFPIQGIFFNRGNVTIGACVDDTHIGKGEDLTLRVACHNDSTAEIERVQVKVYEEMMWKISDWQYKQISRPIAVLDDVRVPGIDTRPKEKGYVRRSQRSRTRQGEIFREIHEALVSGRNEIRLRIPESARDTFTGHLVKVWHYAEIKIKTIALASNASKTIPLRIGTPPARQTAYPVPQQSAAAIAPANHGEYVSPTSQQQHQFQLQQQPEHLRPPPPQVVTVTADAPPQENIPIVAAVAVSPGISPVPTAPSSDNDDGNVIVLGGDAIILEDGDDVDPSDFIPVCTAPPDTFDISVSGLLRTMVSSINDFDIIEERLRDPEWVQLFRSMSADEFGSVVAHVNIDFDQTRVATLLAPHVNGGDCFTCRYAAAAVRNASEWNRSNMTQRLVPLCVDIAVDHGLIRRELSEWDQIVTNREFEDAIAAATMR